MPELVGMEDVDADGSSRMIERLAKRGHAQGRASADARKHEVVWTLTGDVAAEFDDEEPWNEHLTPDGVRVDGGSGVSELASLLEEVSQSSPTTSIW